MVFAHWIKGICKTGKVYAVNEGGILPFWQRGKITAAGINVRYETHTH